MPIETDLTPLTRIDSPLIPYDEFSTSFNIWLSTIVDTVNTNLDRLDSIAVSLSERLTAIGG